MVYCDQDMCESKLGRLMQAFRADRPDEWTMDEFIGMAENMHKMNKELLEALELMIAIHDEPSGFSGKYGKALDDAIQEQEEKIDERLLVARTAVAKAKGTSS